MKKMNVKVLFLGLVSMGFVHASAQTFALQVKNNKITYVNDSKGNRVLDFSYCGYRNSEQDIPNVNNAVFVPCNAGDNWANIQKAIDYVSSLKPDKQGFRGAVLLGKGTYTLRRELRIAASGVVLRGADKEQTVLLKTGVDRGALLYVEGQNNVMTTDTVEVQQAYVPVGSKELQVSQSGSFRVGDRVLVVRPSTKEWIASIGCNIYGGGIDALGWKPGDTDLLWDRTVTAVAGNKLTVDVPFTVALDAAFGKAKVIRYRWTGRIAHSGVENLTMVSDYNKQYPKDEDHAWVGVSIENAENCWVRRVNFKHFSGSAVIVQRTGSRITVEDCISREPISEVGGMRRCTFFTLGQLCLFQRCYSEQGIHDFAAGYAAAGPNAFVQCDTKESLGFSGSIDAWACGLLFDVVNVDGHNLSYKNLGQDKNGAGWNTANSLFWQCTAAEIECYTVAADAPNRAYGCWAQFSGNGEWDESNNHVQPRSIFYAQLQERLQADVDKRARILPRNTSATSSPEVEEAMRLAKESFQPRLTLEQWIEQGSFSASVSADKVKSVDQLKFNWQLPQKSKHNMGLQDGRLVTDGALMVGGRQEVPWWSGKLKTNFLPSAKPHVTRFVPGREGQGLTDRIDSVVNYMKEKNILVLDHNYGLWYDRRRDDHERIRRRDGDVWGPFYEQPFARSGVSTAWEGLSKYDLTHYNKWYWSRLKEFADKGEQEGLLLFHQNYFQHNIIEAGAHWVDSPWRSANNINSTGFPEPVPFAGDKRIFMAEQFYDVTDPVRRELHRKYIRQCLDNFADNQNVIQLVSAEYTGPLHFVEFWLDVIAQWKKETGKHPLIALSTTKDVQDAILNDPARAAVVDVIDIRYWHYKNDGTVYAPEGGKNMAPRQHMRKMKVGKVTFNEAYKAVNEYRTRYPEKAVTFYAQNYPDMAWAIFMAGGSCAQIPVADKDFLRDAAQMHTEATGTDDYCKMVKSGTGIIIYSKSKSEITISIPAGKYRISYVNPRSGEITTLVKTTSVKAGNPLKLPSGNEGVYWIRNL